MASKVHDLGLLRKRLKNLSRRFHRKMEGHSGLQAVAKALDVIEKATSDMTLDLNTSAPVPKRAPRRRATKPTDVKLDEAITAGSAVRSPLKPQTDDD